MLSTLAPMLIMFMQPLHKAEAATAVHESTTPDTALKTSVFLSLSVKVSTLGGTPVILDAYQSINLETGNVLASSAHGGSVQTHGIYVLAHDLQLEEIEEHGSPIQFTGYIGGKQVVRQEFIIGHDTCHVQLLSGDLELQL